MASPVTRGHPRDWRVGVQAPDNGAQLRRRQIINERKPCSCPGCDRLRYGVSRYCSTHRDAASSRGDPLARLPSRNELTIFRHAIAVYLQTDAKLAERIGVDLRALERRMAQPPAFCLSPSDIHKGLPQIAKAKGLLANWQHRDKRTSTEAVTNAVALIGWMEVYYDTGHAGGLWENRKPFLTTRAGALLGDFRKTIGRLKLIKETSGATHRLLGRDFVHHANTIYGKDFWSSPVSTREGQSLTLRDYTRLALKAAGLFSC